MLVGRMVADSRGMSWDQTGLHCPHSLVSVGPAEVAVARMVEEDQNYFDTADCSLEGAA